MFPLLLGHVLTRVTLTFNGNFTLKYSKGVGFHNRIYVCLGIVFLSLAAQAGLKLSTLVPCLNFLNVVEQREFIMALLKLFC